MPDTRRTLSLISIAVLAISIDRYAGNLRIFSASLAVFYILNYIAGGGRAAMEDKRSRLFAVRTHLGLAAAAMLAAWYEIPMAR
jgi:hypothetical protein